MSEQAIEQALRQDFGLQEFRHFQRDTIDRVMRGQDTLAIIPTGGGKSLTYQLPAMLLPGVTLVVSPLIALMKDQVASVPDAIRDRVAYLSGDLDVDERHRVLEGVRTGRIKLLYVAPERLHYPSLRAAVLEAGIALFVVDEAHCISFWGNDFRPVYLMLARTLADYGQPRVLAVTATATPVIADDIGRVMGRRFDTVRASMVRTNLTYEVEQLPGADARVGRVVELCQELEGDGIVYVPSRAQTDQVAQALRSKGIEAAAYHAGLEQVVRDANQIAFMAGDVRVMVATVAFGMGVDKPNVRFVIHLAPPFSVEAYAQETGRAGRDGEPARCVLLAAPSDRRRMKSLITRGLPDPVRLEHVAGLANRERAGVWAPVDHDALERELNPRPDPNPVQPEREFGFLRQVGMVERAIDAPRDFLLKRRPALGAYPNLDARAEQLWRQLLGMIGDVWEARGEARLDTAVACDLLGIEPGELHALLWDRPEVRLEASRQQVAWYRVRSTTPGDRAARFEELARLVSTREWDRAERMLEFIAGTACRHVLLARVFGETIAPCGNRCDICGDRWAQVRRATAADARVVLDLFEEMAEKERAIGRAAALRVLTGDPDNKLRSAHIGRLRDIGRLQIEGVLDDLQEHGLLEPYDSSGFPCLRPTPRGAAARLVELASIIDLAGRAPQQIGMAEPDPPRAPAPRRLASAPAPSPAAGSSGAGLAPAPAPVRRAERQDEDVVYARLVRWWHETARRAEKPPSRIAETRQLEAIARAQPTTVAELRKLAVPGAFVDKYGLEIVAVVKKPR